MKSPRLSRTTSLDCGPEAFVRRPADAEPTASVLRISRRYQCKFEWAGRVRVSESSQVLALFILALPIASIAWTISHEEVVREFRDACLAKSATCRRVYERKFFYLFTR